MFMLFIPDKIKKQMLLNLKWEEARKQKVKQPASSSASPSPPTTRRAETRAASHDHGQATSSSASSTSTTTTSVQLWSEEEQDGDDLVETLQQYVTNPSMFLHNIYSLLHLRMMCLENN